MAKIRSLDATIKTAVVEIKALIVDGKQVTISMFRQFCSEPLIDMTALKLEGIPWGRVNYHADDCKSNTYHLHILWQKGAELRRCSVRQDQAWHTIGPMRLRAETCLAAAFLVAADTNEPTVGGAPVGSDWLRPLYTGGGDDFHCVVCSGVAVKLHAHKVEALRSHWRRRRADPDVTIRMPEHIAQSIFPNHDLKWHTPQGWRSQSCEQWLYESRDASRSAERLETRWSELFESLESLEQLFIAV